MAYAMLHRLWVQSHYENFFGRKVGDVWPHNPRFKNEFSSTSNILYKKINLNLIYTLELISVLALQQRINILRSL